jgi:hypothetical protein
MDNPNAFERQLAAEIDHEVGPPRYVDALAITRAAKTTTPEWRIRSMFSAAKLVTAGLLVFATGAVLSVAQPLGQPSRMAPGAAEVGEPGPAAYVHGAMVETLCCGDEAETYDSDGNRLTLRGMASSGLVEMDDPRLAGSFTMIGNGDEFPQADTSERVEIGWGEVRIENEDGAWSGTFATTYDSEKINETSLILYELTGEGAYEGLSALLGQTGSISSWPRFPVAGAIFTGPLPPR